MHFQFLSPSTLFIPKWDLANAHCAGSFREERLQCLLLAGVSGWRFSLFFYVGEHPCATLKGNGKILCWLMRQENGKCTIASGWSKSKAPLLHPSPLQVPVPAQKARTVVGGGWIQQNPGEKQHHAKITKHISHCFENIFSHLGLSPLYFKARRGDSKPASCSKYS